MVSRPYWQRTSVTHRPPLDPSLAYDDPKLIEAVTKTFLYPPSTEPYNLMNILAETDVNAAQYLLYVNEFAYQFCQKAIGRIFDEATPGFFVEAGALDGEFLSNTLPLERERGWTGLLVEADSDMFNELMRKRRRVWASPSCLATHQHPHTDILIKYIRHNNLNDEFSNHAARAHGSLLGQTGGDTLDGSMPGHPIYEPVQCLPLASLLLAINVTHVDLISLDVEGAEVGILTNFPWSRVTVDVWVVEHAHQHAHTTPTDSNTTTPNLMLKEDAEFVDLFASHGYVLYVMSQDLIIPNYVFVRRGSLPYDRLRTRGDARLSRNL